MRCDPGILAAVRALLPYEPAPAMTGERIAHLVNIRLGVEWPPVPIRRIQEAVAALRAEGVPVVSSSKPPRGYRIAVSDAALADCAREHQRRALESLRMAARLKRMTVKEVVGQMGLFTEEVA